MVFTFKQCMEKWLSVYQINKQQKWLEISHLFCIFVEK